jgi:hypothetical protein
MKDKQDKHELDILTLSAPFGRTYFAAKAKQTKAFL